ncbi:MAG: T9SS type A sorting domain-containing protein [Lewinella sp.]|nr:T9SS type A sorting domain-containing protein [Lewinella sp.]
MKKFSTLLLVLFSLMATSMWAQQRNCGSMEVLDRQIQENPAIQDELNRIENYTRTYLHSTGRDLNGSVLTIPVIVHVVYQNSTENVSDAQINSQITVLNDDFRRLNADASNTPSDFQGVAADTEIEFCLTQIVRVPTSTNSFGTNDSVKFSSSGGSDVITPGSALNIWVCEIGGGILGYAQFPGGSSSTDGVVIDYRYFGTIGTATAPFNLGRTATHEVGHWLNLRHIWGDGGCNVDDFVSDTPEAGSPNYTGSPCTYPGPNTCTPKGRPGQPDDYDMFQNYMDYSDDVCMNLFTTGQKTRMWAAIQSSRPGLLSAACDGTPPPTETCNDGILNNGETGIDCGGPNCAPCQAGTCDAPTGLQHTRRKGGQEGELSWNAVSGASSYDVEVYNASGALHASGTVSSNGAIVGGLTKNAAYTWRVRANCSNGTSDWADGAFNARLNGSFETVDSELMAFPNPTEANTVRLTWNISNAPAMGSGIFESRPLDVQEQGTLLLQVRDLTGKMLYQTIIDGETSMTDLDVTQYAAGMYIIQLTTESGYATSLKLIKQ